MKFIRCSLTDCEYYAISFNKFNIHVHLTSLKARFIAVSLRYEIHNKYYLKKNNNNKQQEKLELDFLSSTQYLHKYSFK